MTNTRGSRRMMVGLSYGPVEDLPDPRAAQVRSLGIVARNVAEERIATLFSGTDLATNDTKVQLIVDAIQLATDSFNKIAENYILICISLYDLSAKLSRKEFATLRNHADSLFPFSRAHASMFRKIGEAVAGDRPRLDAKNAPRDWTTAYQLATLNEVEFALAMERGLVRRDVLRREVEAFRRQIRPARMVTVEASLAEYSGSAAGPSINEIRKERRDSEAELEALTHEVRSALSKLSDLNRRRRNLRELLRSRAD